MASPLAQAGGGDNGSYTNTNRRPTLEQLNSMSDYLARIYGYNKIEMPQAVHSSLSYKTDTDAADDLRRLISEQLTSAGFNEILNNSLTARAYYDDLKVYPADGCVTLLNPLSQDLNVMRRTLLFGGLESLGHNINRKNKDLAFYEFGNVYDYNADKPSTDERPLAPYSQHSRLARRNPVACARKT